jgi:hypothetical protein
MNSLFRHRSKEEEKEEKPLCIHHVQQPTEALSGHHVVEPAILTTDTEGSDTALGHTLSQNDAKGRCQICHQEQVAARNYRIRIIIGIFFPFALQALDVTIIASALPWIASDFSTFHVLAEAALLMIPRQVVTDELDYIGIQPMLRNFHSDLGTDG